MLSTKAPNYVERKYVDYNTTRILLPINVITTYYLLANL